MQFQRHHRLGFALSFIPLVTMALTANGALADELHLKCDSIDEEGRVRNSMIIDIDLIAKRVIAKNIGTNEVKEYSNGPVEVVGNGQGYVMFVTIDQEYIKYGHHWGNSAKDNYTYMIDRRTGIYKFPGSKPFTCAKYVEPTREQLGSPKF